MVRCGGEETLSTSEFASLCDFKHNEVWSIYVKKMTVGRVPFFRGLELDRPDPIVSQFPRLLVSSSTSSIGVLDALSPAHLDPSAPPLPSVEQVLHSVEPNTVAE
jgi:hypothetical protein